jgi:hypothetical protein
MNKYEKGKIYRIVDNAYTKFYYGSTVNELSKRMAHHRCGYQLYKNGKFNYTTSYNLFDDFGVENCKIELVELFPCLSKTELNQREGWYIQNNECVNKVIPGRTEKEYKKQYYQTNKDKLKEHQKEYNEDNKEHLKQKRKEYKQANKEHLKQKRKEYNEANKDKIKEQKKQYYQANKDKVNTNIN